MPIGYIVKRDQAEPNDITCGNDIGFANDMLRTMFYHFVGDDVHENPAPTKERFWEPLPSASRYDTY